MNNDDRDYIYARLQTLIDGQFQLMRDLYRLQQFVGNLEKEED